MLLPADLLSRTLMPWVLAAPALPLAFMLSSRTSFTGINVTLLVASVVTMLTNIFFNLVVRTPKDVRDDILLIGILIEFFFSILLLWNSTQYAILRRTMTAVTTLFIGVLSMQMVMGADFTAIRSVISLGYLLMFLMAATAIMENATLSPTEFITDEPSFWVAAGLLFHFGIMALLLQLLPDVRPEDWSLTKGFGVMFTIATCIRYMLFSVGVVVGKTKPTDTPGF